MKLIDSKLYEVAHEHVGHIKTAAAPTVAHSLSGRLYLSRSGWLLLDVPNALVRGAFDALHESGAELPPRKHGGNLNAHVSVMTKDEVNRIGADKINERGHQFHYTLGPLKEVEPAGWDEMSRCWFIEISSPELKNLRKSYGLSPLPNGDHQFHVTVAVRRKHVLKNNDVKKAESDDKKARIRNILADYTDKELDGIYVDYHPGPPPKIWLDVMDWGDGKIGGELHDAFVKIVGKKHITMMNEGGKPHREDCGGKWHKLAEVLKAEARPDDWAELERLKGVADAAMDRMNAANTEIGGTPLRDLPPNNPLRKLWDQWRAALHNQNDFDYSIYLRGAGKGPGVMTAPPAINKPKSQPSQSLHKPLMGELGNVNWPLAAAIGGGTAALGAGAYGLYRLTHRDKHKKPVPNTAAEEAMDKGASIIMPLIRAGGLYTDVAGIRALAAGQKDQPPDPAEEVENDTSYLNQLRPKRKKKPRVVSAETSLTPLSMPAKLAEAVKMISMQGHKQENDYSCGPGALKTLFDHYDKNESEHKIREATDADPEAGTRPEELAEHARDKGLDAEVIEHTSFSDLEQMVDSGEPVICNIQAWGDKENYPKDESGHYVVLTGYDADKFYFKDPALGDKPGELLRRDMGERWHDQEADGDKTDRLAIPIRKRGNTHPPVVRTQPPEAKKIAASTSQVGRPTRQ